MRDDEFSTQHFVEALRAQATEDGLAGEYHPEEHVLWLASTRLLELEEIVNILDGDCAPSREALASLLTRLAGVLKHGKAHHIYTYVDDAKEDK